MQYDPIKRRLGVLVNRKPFLRRQFYGMLDLLLLRSWHVRKALKALKTNLPATEIRILDAGSGFGQYGYRLSSMFPAAKILGLDVKAEQIEDCNRFFQQIGRQGEVTFEEADLTQYRQPDQFHLILSVDVMEHIAEDEKVFKNFSESLKPGGILLISTPSDQGGSDTDHHEPGDAHGFIGEHVRDGYSAADITEKLLKAGFSRVEVAYTYGKYGTLAWRWSMKYPILMLGFSSACYLLLPFYYLIVFPVCALLNYVDVSRDNPSGTGLLVKAFKQ